MNIESQFIHHCKLSLCCCEPIWPVTIHVLCLPFQLQAFLIRPFFLEFEIDRDYEQFNTASGPVLP